MLNKYNYDEQNRHRNVMISSRISQGESEMLKKMVKISGMTKQDYIRKRLECKDIVVVGNPKVYKALKYLLIETNEKLSELIEKNEQPDKDLIDLIGIIVKVLDGLKNNDTE